MPDDTPTWAAAIEARLISHIDSRISGLDSGIAGLDSRIGRLESRISSLDSRIGELATRDELGALREELHRVRADIMVRIGRLQDALTRHREEADVNYSMAATTAGRIASLEDSIIALTRMLKRLQTRLDDLEGRQDPH
jgi:chromosome segregation ATPase